MLLPLLLAVALVFPVAVVGLDCSRITLDTHPCSHCCDKCSKQMQLQALISTTSIYTTSCRTSRCDTAHYAFHAICMSHIHAYTVVHTVRTCTKSKKVVHELYKYSGDTPVQTSLDATAEFRQQHCYQYLYHQCILDRQLCMQ
jgi:hypothetical protein